MAVVFAFFLALLAFAPASVRGESGPVLIKEKLVLFDCEPPDSELATRYLARLYDVQVVKMGKDLTSAGFLERTANIIRKHPADPRFFALFCEGEMVHNRLRFLRRDPSASNSMRLAYSVDAGEWRQTVEDALNEVRRENVIFFLNTCNSGAIADTFRAGTQAFGDGSTILAATPKGLEDNRGLQLPVMLLRLHRNCQRYDLNRDGKIDIREFKLWAESENAAIRADRRRIATEMNRYYELELLEAERDIQSGDPVRRAAGEERRREILRSRFFGELIEEYSYFGTPLTYGIKNDDAILFHCPENRNP